MANADCTRCCKRMSKQSPSKSKVGWTWLRHIGEWGCQNKLAYLALRASRYTHTVQLGRDQVTLQTHTRAMCVTRTRTTCNLKEKGRGALPSVSILRRFQTHRSVFGGSRWHLMFHCCLIVLFCESDGPGLLICALSLRRSLFHALSFGGPGPRHLFASSLIPPWPSVLATVPGRWDCGSQALGGSGGSCLRAEGMARGPRPDG